jgi:hypothetical protein
MTEQNNRGEGTAIYRYKLEDSFVSELYKFSKIHQYDHRKDFKEAWNVWTEENEDIVSKETRRLVNLGYDGDIMDKIFKSARYYFRKKSTEKREPVQRRDYISCDKEFLELIDNHIKTSVKSNKQYKPSTGFVDFCNNESILLKEEVGKLFKLGLTDAREIHNKIKKTYKNRYFILINS